MSHVWMMVLAVLVILAVIVLGTFVLAWCAHAYRVARVMLDTGYGYRDSVVILRRLARKQAALLPTTHRALGDVARVMPPQEETIPVAAVQGRPPWGERHHEW